MDDIGGLKKARLKGGKSKTGKRFLLFVGLDNWVKVGMAQLRE